MLCGKHVLGQWAKYSVSGTGRMLSRSDGGSPLCCGGRSGMHALKV